MVAIVSGNSLGIELSSLSVLGARGVIGEAASGAGGQRAYVNIASGNLVLQARDEFLASRGADIEVLRSYNSQGQPGGASSLWQGGVMRQHLSHQGALATAGAWLSITARDGGMARYDWDAGRGLYVGHAGEGAFDTVRHDAANRQFIRTDGDSGQREIYQDDGAGRLLAVVDRDGNRSDHVYDSAGMLTESRDASGEKIRYTYEAGRLMRLEVLGPDGGGLVRVAYRYDALERLGSVLLDLTPEDGDIGDGKVYRSDYRYDGDSSRISAVMQSDGSRQEFTYVQLDGLWRVASVADALGQQIRYDYDLAGHQTRVTDALGVVTTCRYDDNGRLTEVGTAGRQGPGVVAGAVHYRYDAQGKLVEIRDGNGQVTSMAYDDQGNQVLWRDASGATVRRSFDGHNQLRSETLLDGAGDPASAGAAGTGAAGGNAANAIAAAPAPAGSAATANGHTTRYVYDSAGRGHVRFLISAEGRVTQYQYNAYGERIGSMVYTGRRFDLEDRQEDEVPDEATMMAWVASADPQAVSRTDMHYDSRGLLASQTVWNRLDQAGAGVADGYQTTTRFVYDQAGRLLQSVAGKGATSSQVYDGLGRVILARDALGRLSSTSYDDAGGAITTTLADGRSTTSVFDRAGRLSSRRVSFSGDPERPGLAAAVLGTQDYFYDAAGHLVMTQDPTGVRAWMLYDENGRKAADIDGNGSLTEYAYDGSGQLLRTLRHASAVDVGRLVDRDGKPLLPALDLLRPPPSPEDSCSWQVHDGAGRVSRTVDGSGAVVDMVYDAASHLVRTHAYGRQLDLAGLDLLALSPAAANSLLAALEMGIAQDADRVTRYFYDADGLLVGTLDAEGMLREQVYDAGGALTATIAYARPTSPALWQTGDLAQLRPDSSAEDIFTTRRYDAQRRLIAETDGEGYLTQTLYSESGNVIVRLRHAVAVENSLRLRLLGDPAGIGAAELAGLASPADRMTTTRLDLLGRVIEQRDEDGVLTLYEYGSDGQLSRTLTAAGTDEARLAIQRHDAFGRVSAELSGVGAALLSGAGSADEVESVWRQYGVHHDYDAAGRRISSTDQYGALTLYFYDADGRLTCQVGADGAVTENRYDVLGRLASVLHLAQAIDARGLRGGLDQGPQGELAARLALARDDSRDSRLDYRYDHAGRLSTIVDALGFVTTNTWNAFGELSAQSRQLSASVQVRSASIYDRRGLKIADSSDVTGVNATARHEYDAFGRLVRSVDAGGAMHRTWYDHNGRTILQTDAMAGTQGTAYDAFGRVVSRTDAMGQVTRYRYGSDPRSLSVTTPENITVATRLNRHGQTLSVTDGRGNTTSYRYDADGHLLATSSPTGELRQQYDRAGRLASSVDARGVETTLDYDAAGRVVTRSIDPAGLNLRTRYRFDASGRQISVTDPDGVVTEFAYDRNGQLISQTVDPSGLKLRTGFEYDARGQTLSVTAPGGETTRYVYDTLGRRTEQHVDAEGLDLVSRYSYDLSGNMVRSTDPNGHATRHVYDANGRLVYTIDAIGQVQQLVWDGAGRQTASIRYAQALDLARLGDTADVKEAQVASLLLADPAQDRREWLSYDKDGRLIASMNGLGEVTTRSYDENGNLTGQRRYAARVDPAGATAGSAIPLPAADPLHDWRQQTVYDAANRAIYQLDSNGAISGQKYDGNGNLTERIACGVALPADLPASAQAVAQFLAALQGEAGAAGHGAAPATSAAATAATAPSLPAASPAPTAAGPAVPPDRREVFRYDAANRLVWRLDAGGAVSRTIYDARGNPVRQIGYAATLAPGADPESVVPGAADRVTDLVYDTARRLLWRVDALGQITRLVSDANGNQVVSIAYGLALAPPSSASDTPYRAQDILARLGTAAPDAGRDHLLWQGFDGAGRKVLSIDAAGAVTEFFHDAAGNVVATIAHAVAVDAAALMPPDADLLSPAVAASHAARMASLLRADAQNDRRDSQRYDAVDRVIERSDAEGFLSRLAYDGLGNLLSRATGMTAGGGADNVRIERYTRDQQGRLLSTTDALGFSEHYRYDALGNKLAFTNKNGATWRYEYDGAGHVLQETSPQVELLSLSGAGGAASAGDPQSGVLAVDAGHSGPGSVITRLAYDVFGDLRSRTEAFGRPEQRTTWYEFDALGRQVRPSMLRWAYISQAAMRWQKTVAPAWRAGRTAWKA